MNISDITNSGKRLVRADGTLPHAFVRPGFFSAIGVVPEPSREKHEGGKWNRQRLAATEGLDSACEFVLIESSELQAAWGRKAAGRLPGKPLQRQPR
jgi:hypothetical protein